MLAIGNTFIKKIVVASAGAIMALIATQASAGTVEDIKSRGKIVVGVQGDNPPWGLMNSKQEFEGFDPDVARLLAKELGVEVEFVPLAVTNRIPTLVTGKADVLFATLTMLPDRAKVVQFTQPYVAFDIGLVAAKDAKIASADDLTGMTVGVPRGTTMDAAVTRTSPSDVTILRFDDDSATQQALLSGQVQAAGANQFWVARLEGSNPGQYEMKFKYQTFFNGAATKLGDKEWNAYLNTFIDKIKADGELAAIYQKWMQRQPHEFPASIEGVPYTAQ